MLSIICAVLKAIHLNRYSNCNSIRQLESRLTHNKATFYAITVITLIFRRLNIFVNILYRMVMGMQYSQLQAKLLYLAI